MNCPNCGSSFTEEKRREEQLNETKISYQCMACNRKFEKTTKKSGPNGKILMTLYGGLESWGNYTHIAEIIERENGTLYIRQKTTDIGKKPEFRNTTTVPKFKTEVYLGKTNLGYDSFSWVNDKNGTLFSVRKIELNKELKEKARKSEAMRIALKDGFLSRSQDSDVVLAPVARWLNNELAPYKNKKAASSQTSSSGSESKGGCYVATAVYGSYDCPEVWTLRRFRDDTLASTQLGRMFIRTYYAISPTVVKLFGNTAWFKKMWQKKLDRMVADLQNKGVESTPYEDKKW